MKKLYFALLLLLLAFKPSNSQDVDYKELFLAAESFYLFEEFNEALPLYMRIHRQFPENDNINFKIGVCYLNDPFQKEKSISYLEEAVENINLKYKENNFKEESAPLESLFQLANAYHVNNQLDNAKKYYREFLEKMDPEVYDAQLVQDQIDACNIAKELMNKPIDNDIENLGSRINTRFSDVNAVVSGDEKRMAFISKLQFYDAVFYTEKINGEWTAPRNIIPELGVDGDVYPTSISYDGTEMFIYRNDEFIGNLYSSKLVDGKWTPLVKLNDNINTRYWESHASISGDGKTLYFSSNRKGGYGGLDIYRSEKQPNGEWGPPVNLGPTINTPYNDDTPFITANEDKIFFSSYGHYNMGGYDIFLSKKNTQGEWGEPLNLGYPLNTTDDNQFFMPLYDGQIAYYSKFDPKGGYGRFDIYRYRIYTADHPRMYSIEGSIDFQGENFDPDEINISVIDKATSDTLASLNPDADANFNFEVPQGKYDVVFDSDRFRKKILELEVGPDTPHTGLKLEAPVVLVLIPAIIPVDEAEDEEILTILDDSVIYASPGEIVDIRFNASEGSTVKAEAYNKSELIKSENIPGTGEIKKFSFAVKPGENIVTLSAADPEGTKSIKTVKVIVPDLAETKSDGSFVAKEETGIPSTEKISGDTEAARLLDILRDAATLEALKKFLNELDLEKENITTNEELISHIYDSVDRSDFTKSDVDKLMIDAGVLTALDILIRDLAEVSSPALKDYLLNLDPHENGITSERQLYDFLLDNSESENYSRKDVYEAISRYKYADADIQKIIDDLIALSEGNLKQALQELNPTEQGITSLVDILNYLLDNTDNYGYTQEDVYDLFYRYLISGERKDRSKDETEMKERFSRGAKLTAGILLLEGLIILILILLARRKKNKKPSGTDLQ